MNVYSFCNSTFGGRMKKLLLAVFCLLPAAVSVQAADLVAPNWGVGNISGQNRVVTDNSNNNKSLAIVGAGSLDDGSVSNSSLTIDGVQVNITTDSVANEAYSSTAPTEGAYVAGGAVFNNTAANNTLNISNTSLTGRDAYGGAATLKNPSSKDRFDSGSANGNTVNITNAQLNAYTFTPTGAAFTTDLGGNVYGGYSEYALGTANNNTVNISGNSTINGNVYGGKINDFLTAEDLQTPDVLNSFANNNFVHVSNSTVNGTVAGAAGATTSNNNTVLVEDSTVTSVFGVDQSQSVENGNASITYANNNAVTIKNSQIENAAAVSTKSINASGNSLTIENSTIANGSIYAVNMGLNLAASNQEPVTAVIEKNQLNLLTLNGTFTELGSGLNMVGTSNGNMLNISGSNLTLQNNAGTFFNNTLNLQDLADQELLNLTADKGLIFGGASMTYTATVNTAPTEEAPTEQKVAVNGTNSDNNTINISNGTVEGTILGGFSAYIDQRSYQTIDESGVITTVLKKGTEVTTTSSDPDAEPVEPETIEKIDDVYSASNNTVILDGVNFTGTLYGGYVYGAELKEENMLTQNNTVVLRGNVALDNSSVLYGGSNATYAQSNNLIFDRTVATFNSKDQFQNFNDIWNINANFETDTNFNFQGVYAKMTLDSSAMKEASETVVTTQTNVDLTNIQQGEKIYDLTDNGIVLVNNKLGVYSYELTGVKGSNDTTVDWVLTSTKDKVNAEVYGQLPLVGLALATEGVEMLSHTMGDAWKDNNDSNTFLNGGYHDLRYETGSGFDLNSAIFQAGAWKKFTDSWMGGLFAKYGTGSYDTFPIRVSGDADVYAGGLMTSWRYSDTGRLEASAQIGYMDMEFTSGELSSAFNSKGVYYGANAGFVENLIQDLNLYANINWLHKGSDSVTDNLSQQIKYNSMQSLAARFGGEYYFSSWDVYGLTPSIGLSGIYEFQGKSKVTVEGVKSQEASMKGLSGRGQIGLEYHSYDTYFPLRTALTVFGQAGKREGWGAEANITFEF